MTLYKLHTNIGGLPEYTENTRSCTRTSTGHDRRLYDQDRSRPTTLYTFYTIMQSSSEYTKNTRSCVITYTGHDRRLYNQDRSRPTTLYTFYTIMQSSSEYTENTRSCIMTYTDHDRSRPITTDDFVNVSHHYWGSGRPASVFWYDDHGRALPTVRIIVPSSRMVSVRPKTIVQSISEQ